MANILVFSEGSMELWERYVILNAGWRLSLYGNHNIEDVMYTNLQKDIKTNDIRRILRKVKILGLCDVL